MHLARVSVLRIAVDLALVAALAVLVIAGLGLGAGRANPWAIAPGPRAVTATQAARCLSGKRSVAEVARAGSALAVTFGNGASVRLRFFARVSMAWRSAPVTYAPTLTHSSLSNAVITRSEGSKQPPRASLFALGPCLVTS
jgi:hypothetical protein